MRCSRTGAEAAWPQFGDPRDSQAGLLDDLDAVVVGIFHEHEPRAALADGVRRLLRLDALFSETGQRAVEVVAGDRYVTVSGADVVRIDAEVVGELKARHVAVAGLVHEDVEGLIADRDAPDLLEAERLVKGNRAVDVGDAVAGVDERHARQSMRPAVATRRPRSAIRARRAAAIADASGPSVPRSASRCSAA